jgi:hypothetical protein
MNKRSGSRDGMGSAMDDSQQSPTDGKLVYLEEGAGALSSPRGERE